MVNTLAINMKVPYHGFIKYSECTCNSCYLLHDESAVYRYIFIYVYRLAIVCLRLYVHVHCYNQLYIHICCLLGNPWEDELC